MGQELFLAVHSCAWAFRDRNGFWMQFGRDLRSKAREQNSATESSSLGNCQGYHRKEAWLLRWDNESRIIVRL